MKASYFDSTYDSTCTDDSKDDSTEESRKDGDDEITLGGYYLLLRQLNMFVGVFFGGLPGVLIVFQLVVAWWPLSGGLVLWGVPWVVTSYYIGSWPHLSLGVLFGGVLIGSCLVLVVAWWLFGGRLADHFHKKIVPLGTASVCLAARAVIFPTTQRGKLPVHGHVCLFATSVLLTGSLELPIQEQRTRATVI